MARSANPFLSPSEAAWQASVIEAARLNGWRVYWIPDWVWRIILGLIKKQGPRRGLVWAPPGWPDLVLCRPPELIIAELKSDTGVVREEQHAWLDDLAACGIETHVWRPRDKEEVDARLLRPRR